MPKSVNLTPDRVAIPTQPSPEFLAQFTDELHDYSFHNPHSDRYYWAKRLYAFVVNKANDPA